MSDVSNTGNTITAVVEINGVRETKQIEERQTGFDPMTGNATVEMQVANGFDAMTGEPAYASVKQVGFDPETGLPLYVLKDLPPVPVTAANNSIPVADKVSSGVSKKIIIPIAIVAGLAVLAGIIYFIFTNVLLSSRDKVALAVVKTLKEDTIGGAAYDAYELLADSDALTVETEGKVKVDGVNVKVSGSVAQDASEGKAGADLLLNISGISEQTIGAYYDGSKIQLSAPDLIDYVFEYNYSGKNNGYLAELFEDETDVSIDDLNKCLVIFNDLYKKSPKYKKAVQDAVKKSYKQIDVKKIKADKYEVDGKDRKCQGYQVKVEGDDFEFLANEMKDALKDTYGKSLDELADILSDITGEDIDTDEIFEELDDLDFDDIDDFEFEVYIYKGKLAAIEQDDLDLSIEFLGGDTRTANMKISVDGATVKRKAEVKSGVEEGSLTTDFGGKIKYEYEYNTKTGEFSINPPGGNKINGTILVKSGKSITFRYDGEIDWNDVDLTCTLKKGASIKELKGKKFDVGNADEDDLEDLVDEVEDIVGDLIYTLF